MPNVSNSMIRKTGFCRAWLWAVAVLLMSGIIYRAAEAKLRSTACKTASPAVQLKLFPLKLKDWTGEDIFTDYPIEKIIHSDYFIYRLYRNSSTNEWVNVYITYYELPRLMLGHRPETCYTVNGWNLKKTDKLHLNTPSGINVPCNKYLFYKPAPWSSETAVLNFYIFNGRLTDNEEDFSGLKWRSPKTGGNYGRYAAQIQISSAFEETAVSAARDMAESIIDLFPDEKGVVRTSSCLSKNL